MGCRLISARNSRESSQSAEHGRVDQLLFRILFETSENRRSSRVCEAFRHRSLPEPDFH